MIRINLSTEGHMMSAYPFWVLVKTEVLKKKVDIGALAKCWSNFIGWTISGHNLDKVKLLV